jgi:hypothetical protein
MSNKKRIDPLDDLIRQTACCGMTVGTVMVIEFISGFELFNTRPYHNYETWSQGYRVHGLGVKVESEDLDDAIREWSVAVKSKRAGEPIKPWQQSRAHNGEPYRTPAVLEDWDTPEEKAQ